MFLAIADAAVIALKMKRRQCWWEERRKRQNWAFQHSELHRKWSEKALLDWKRKTLLESGEEGRPLRVSRMCC